MSRMIERSSNAVSHVLRGAVVGIALLAAGSALAQALTLDQLARDNVAQKMRLRTGSALIAPAPAAASSASRVGASAASTPGIGPQRLLAVYGVASSLVAEIDFGGNIARLSSERPGPTEGWTLASIAPTQVVLVRRTERGEERRVLAMGAGGRDASGRSSVIHPGAATGPASSIPLAPLLSLSPLLTLPPPTAASAAAR